MVGQRTIIDSRRVAILAAIVVFCSGFLLPGLASLIGLGSMSSSELFASVGGIASTAIFLPLLAYALSMASGPFGDWCSRVRRQALFGASIGTLVGAVILAHNLPGSTAGNVSQSKNGAVDLVFLSLGIFVLMGSGGYAAVATVVIARLRSRVTYVNESGIADSLNPIRLPGAVATIFLLLSIVALVLQVEFPDGRGLVPLVLGLVLCATLLVGLLAWATRGLLWPTLTCMAATLMACSLCLLFESAGQAESATLMAVFSAAFIGAFCGFSIRLNVRSRIFVTASSALCSAGPICAFSALPVVGIPELLAGCAVSTSVVVGFLFLVRFLFAKGYQSLYAPDYSMPREAIGHWGQVWRNIAGGPLSVVLTTLATLPVTGYALTGRYLAQEQRLANLLASAAAVALAILVIVIPGRLVRIALDVVVDAEMTNASQGELVEVKISAFMAFFSMYAGVLCAYLSFLIGSIQPDVWISGVDPGFETILNLACVLLVLIVVGLVAARARQVIARWIGLVACWIWSVVMASLLMEGYEDFKQATLSILVSLTAGLFIMEGVVSNMGYLHGSPVDWQVLLTAATCALAVGTTAAWVTGPALISEAGATELPFALSGLVTGSLACISLPWLAARALSGAKPLRMYTLGAPVGGVVQDLIIIVVLVASVAWVPNFLMGHINNLGIWFGQIIPFLLLLSAAFKYFLVVNIQYAKR